MPKMNTRTLKMEVSTAKAASSKTCCRMYGSGSKNIPNPVHRNNTEDSNHGIDAEVQAEEREEDGYPDRPSRKAEPRRCEKSVSEGCAADVDEVSSTLCSDIQTLCREDSSLALIDSAKAAIGYAPLLDCDGRGFLEVLGQLFEPFHELRPMTNGSFDSTSRHDTPPLSIAHLYNRPGKE